MYKALCKCVILTPITTCNFMLEGENIITLNLLVKEQLSNYYSQFITKILIFYMTMLELNNTDS